MTLAGLVSWPVARATFRERAYSAAAAAVSLLAAISAAGATASGGSGAAFTNFTRLFVIALTMVVGAGLIADEMDNGHAQLVLLRPITRAEWFGGRLAGAGLALLAGMALAWLGGLFGLLRGGTVDVRWAASLPLAYVEALGWLAILAALSVVARRSMNVGILLLLALLYFFLATMVPLVFGRPAGIQRAMELGKYVGPIGTDEILARWDGARFHAWRIFFDLLWIFGAWLAGVWLFNQRELARRRG